MEPPPEKMKLPPWVQSIPFSFPSHGWRCSYYKTPFQPLENNDNEKNDIENNNNENNDIENNDNEKNEDKFKLNANFENPTS